MFGALPGRGGAKAPLAGSGGGGRRVNPRTCTGGSNPGGGDEFKYIRPRRGVPASRPLFTASPLASAAAVTATGLSLSSASTLGSSTISSSGVGLPSGGLLANRGPLDDISVDVAPAGLSPTTLYLNKQASIAECCVPNARYRETFPIPLPFEQQGMRI